MNVNDKAAKRRGWIKNIAIIFLAIMLVLTLFSNTIMNFSLPEVSAQYCYSGSITTNVTGSGAVEAKESYNVVADRTFKITDVGVKVGSEVKAGDVMFLLDDTGSQDLITAMEELSNLKKSKTELIQKMSNSEYTTAMLELSRLQEDLQLAKNANTKLTAANLTLKTIEDQKNAANEKITNINTKILEIEKKYKSSEFLSDINQAKAEFDTATAASETADAALKQAEQVLKEAEKKKKETANAYETFITQHGDGSQTVDLDQLKKDLAQLELEYQRLNQDYNTFLANDSAPVNEALAKYDELLQRAFLAADELKNGYITDEEYNQIVADMNAALKAYNEANQAFEAAKLEKQRALEDKTIAINYKKEEISKASTNNTDSESYNAERTRLKTEMDNASIAFDNATLAKELAELDATEKTTALEKATDLYEILKLKEEKVGLDATFADLSAQYDKAKSEADNIQSLAKTDSEIMAMERNIQDKALAVEALKKANSDSGDANELELETLEAKIKLKEEEIEKFKDTTALSQFTAPVDGIVTEINFSAGQTANLNDTIAKIQLVDKGYMVQFSLSTDQAKRIRVGDIAKVQNYWGGNVNAIVDSIVPDKNDPQKTKIVTVNVTGDVSIGTNLSFSIGEKSQNYDMVVPISALREDNNGSFVYIVSVKPTPLGNRYTAKRADVQIIAKDNTSAAVSGLNYGDFVIVTSSAPINAGTQVRMVEA